MTTKILTLCGLLLGNVFLYGQVSPLDQRITVDIQSETLENALDKIADAGNFNFSYNPNLLAVDKIVSVQANQKKVEKVLAQLLDAKRYYYQVKDDYVIILLRTEKPAPAPIAQRRSAPPPEEKPVPDLRKLNL